MILLTGGLGMDTGGLPTHRGLLGALSAVADYVAWRADNPRRKEHPHA